MVLEIRTARLRHRPFAPEHEAGLLALWNDPDVRDVTIGGRPARYYQPGRGDLADVESGYTIENQEVT